MTRIAGLFIIFSLAACDANTSSSNSVVAAKESGQATQSDNVVYFPDGGGVAFSKPSVGEQQGPDWKYKEFIVDNDWEVLKSAVTETMEKQGYVSNKSFDLQDFEQGLSFSKKGSLKRVTYRAKKIKSAVGERILVRLSWHV